MYRKKGKKEAIQGLCSYGRGPKYVQTDRTRARKRKKEKVEPGAGVSQVLSLGAMGVNKVRADGISWRS